MKRQLYARITSGTVNPDTNCKEHIFREILADYDGVRLKNFQETQQNRGTISRDKFFIFLRIL